MEETDPGAAQLADARSKLAEFDKPCLVAFSDSDPIFPFPAAAEFFSELIPGAGEPVKIEGAAHFLQEDQPHQIVEAILSAFGRPIGA